MRSFTTLRALVAPLDRANVDTDAILAKQFMKSIQRTGYGDHLFDQWRYMDHGEFGMDNAKRPKNPQFSLNQSKYQGAQILLTRENFGCGSSREHAPWALWDYGFRVLIAPSFADIFYSNCFKNGILPIVLNEVMVDELFRLTEECDGLELCVDLAEQLVLIPGGNSYLFNIDAERKRRLLAGLDDIAITLEKSALIYNHERVRRVQVPWLYLDQ